MSSYLVCLMMLTGCYVEPDSDLKKFAEMLLNKTASHALKKPLASIPAFEKPIVYRYEARHLRSPFEKASFALLDKPTITQAAEHMPRQARAKELLELYPLDSLKMVGSIQKQAMVFGLVRDNGGNIYRVKVGDYIGQNEGQIESIDEKTIYIQEKHYQETVNPEIRQIILPLIPEERLS